VSDEQKTAAKVARRRIKRRLKAAASIALALSAGAFLACQRGVQEVVRAVDASKQPDAESSNTDSPIDVRDASGALLASNDAAPDALAKRDASSKDASVDVNEHRKGMPVPDNLLE